MRWVAIGAGIGVVTVAAATVLYLTAFTVDFRLDGRPLRLSSGSTVSQLFSRGFANRHAGNLVAAKDHRVLKSGAGSPPYVSLDGSPLAPSDPIARSADLMSHDGTDSVEPMRVSTETIETPIRFVGSGPVQSVLSSGSEGVQQLTVGVVSGQVVRKRVLVAPVTRVVRLSPAYRGTKMVALTFDDGPWPGSTKEILSILEKYGVKATFFEIGRQARQSPSLSRMVANAGMEIGNHSETHPLNLGRLSAAAVSNQITQAQFDIRKASGQSPAFFRPPGGNTTSAMYPVLAKMGLGWVQWDIDTEDWKRPPATAIVSKVMAHVRPGAVILMHDGGGDRSHTVQALPTIIQQLKAQGYVFVGVSALPHVPHRMG